ncbi:hypothetical protein AAVH_11734 [Aphelenchoides avenae]|nr:hypothetical protein AAVH_11734 [Aphelenchus avenae]
MSCYFGVNYGGRQAQSVYFSPADVDQLNTAVETKDASATAVAENNVPQEPTLSTAAHYTVPQIVNSTQNTSAPSTGVPPAVQKALDDYWRCKEALDHAARRLQVVKQASATTIVDARAEQPQYTEAVVSTKTESTVPSYYQTKTTVVNTRGYQQDASVYFGDDELNNMQAAYAPRPLEYHYAPRSYTHIKQADAKQSGSASKVTFAEDNYKSAVDADESVVTSIEPAKTLRRAPSQYHFANLRDYSAWEYGEREQIFA